MVRLFDGLRGRHDAPSLLGRRDVRQAPRGAESRIAASRAASTPGSPGASGRPATRRWARRSWCHPRACSDPEITLSSRRRASTRWRMSGGSRCARRVQRRIDALVGAGCRAVPTTARPRAGAAGPPAPPSASRAGSAPRPRCWARSPRASAGRRWSVRSSSDTGLLVVGQVVLVVEPAHGQHRRRAGGRQDGMPGLVPGVADRRAHEHAGARERLGRLRQRIR